MGRYVKNPLLGDRNEVEIPPQRKPAPLRRGARGGFLKIKDKRQKTKDARKKD